MASDNQGWQDFTIQGSNEDEKLSAYYWPTDNPRGLLVIVHGLAEHAGRYDAFARYMNQRKIAVVAYDQRGHGRTAANGGKHGFVAPRQTTNILLADINRAIAWARQLVPGAPLVLMGHSMGSLLVRVALADPGLNESCKAAIFSGTAGHPGIAGRAGVLLAGLISLFRGPSHPSRLIDSMVFGAYAAKFSPVRTGFDWLSRDEAMVDAYIADPWCGFT
ncbi:MAG: alpha/beta fold hydrolase, partial [Spirochaetaceae bacterium]